MSLQAIFIFFQNTQVQSQENNKYQYYSNSHRIKGAVLNNILINS